MKIDWEEIRKEWEGTDKTYKELEEQFGVKSATIRSRRSREKWEHYTVADEKRRVAKGLPPKDKKATSKRMKRRSGNPNPTPKFPKRNQAARKHGLFAKYLPKETRKLMKRLNNLDPAEILWDQIMIQYAAIIRAQEIMFVRDSADHSQFTKKEMKIESYTNEDDVDVDKWVIEYDNSSAQEKHASFMAAQSRAMSELRGLIKQYVAIADESDERRLKLELMQANIDKTNAEITKMKGDDFVEFESDGFIEAIAGVEDVWKDGQ